MKKSLFEGPAYIIDELSNSLSSMSSKQYSVVIPSLTNDIYYFNPNCYDIKKLGKFMSKKQFDDIIFTASKIYGNSLFQKQKNDIFYLKFSNKLSISINLILILFNCIFFSLCLVIKKGLVFYIFGIFFSSITLFISIILGFLNYCRTNREYITLKKIIKTNLDDYLRIINKNLEKSGITNIEFTYNDSNRSIICFIENNDVINEVKEEENETSKEYDNINNNIEEEKKIENNNNNNIIVNNDTNKKENNNLKFPSKNSLFDLSKSIKNDNLIFNFSRSESISSNNIDDDNKMIPNVTMKKNFIKKESYNIKRNNILKSSAKNIKKINYKKNI